MTRIVADWLSAPESQALTSMLVRAGHTALFVGGCVRNTLLGLPVDDLDLATDALPPEVMKLAEENGYKVIPTGIEHGTVTVVLQGKPFEVTTFRRDVATDGRRAVVAFSTEITDDARRRDFTMNALYVGADGLVQDPLDGLPDLYARRIRFIENPDKRIIEDYLRILRFFRFHAWFGDPEAGLDPDGLSACAKHIAQIATLSRERIGHEMLKLLASADPAPAVAAMEACGALAQVLPGATTHNLAVLIHIERDAGLEPYPLRRLAILGGEDVADRLRLSRQEESTLAKIADTDISASVAGYRHGMARAMDILAVQAAIAGRAIRPDEKKAASFAAGQVFPLSADDLMPRLQGPALGQALRHAEAKWIASGFTLGKSALVKGCLSEFRG